MQLSGGDGSAVGGDAYRKLATTLETVFSEAVYDRAALQDEVCSYVSELKQSGMHVQSVILAARNLVRETAARFPPSDRTEELLTRMVGWCLEHFYKESA